MQDKSKLLDVKASIPTLQPVSVFPSTAQYLRGRFLFGETVNQVGWGCWSAECELLLREFFEKTAEVGDIVAVLYDAEGDVAGLRLWPIPTYPGRRTKRLAMELGEGSQKGKILCNPAALRWLRGEFQPVEILFFEGESDFLTGVQVWGGREDVAIVGIGSGWWGSEFGAKVGGARVVLRIDADGPGDTYAKKIYSTLPEGCEVWRYQEPDAERPKPRDQNKLLCEGLLGEGVSTLALCSRWTPPPEVEAPAPAPASEGSKRGESYGDEDGWRLCRAALWWAEKWAAVLVLAQGPGGTHHDKKGWATQGFICLRAAHGLQARAHRVTEAQKEKVEGSALALLTLEPSSMEKDLAEAAMVGAGADEATQANRKGRIEGDAKKAAKDPMDMDGLCRRIDDKPELKPKKEKAPKKEKTRRAPKTEPDPFDTFDGDGLPGAIAANEDATPSEPVEPPIEPPPTGDAKPPFEDFPEGLVVEAWGAWMKAQQRAVRVAEKGRWAVIEATHAPDMDLESWGRLCDQKPWQRIPSESEMAWRLLERCQPPGAPAALSDEGTLWAYDPGSGLWVEVDQDRACLMMTGWDGKEIPQGDEDEWKKPETVRVNKRNSEAAYELALRYSKAEGFFDDAPHGFMTRAGFMLVNIEEKKITMMDKDPAWRARHLIDVDLTQENKAAPMLVQYLSTVHAGHADAQQRVTLMGETIFVALTGLGPFFKRAVMLQGKGGSGKSQLLDMIKKLIPKRARCVVPPQLMGEEYHCAKLAGMMLNLVTDIEAGEIIKEGSIKAIVHGEDVHGRNPYGRPFTVAPRALHMFSCNTWPAAPGVSDAFWDRWIAIRFEHRFRETESDIKDIGKYIAKHELNAMVTWAVNCGAELLERGKYTVPDSTFAIMREWQNEGDSVAAWRMDASEPAQDMTERGRRKWWPATEAYQHYKEWCGKNGYKGIVNITNFGRRLKSNDVASHRFDWGIVYAIQEKRPADKPPDFL